MNSARNQVDLKCCTANEWESNFVMNAWARAQAARSGFLGATERHVLSHVRGILIDRIALLM